MICDYCQQKAILIHDSSEIYSRNYGPIWICHRCQAWVGTHKNSKDFKPLGRLANAELRRKKMKAHFWFDKLWREKMAKTGCSKIKARQAAYTWLSKKLQIPVSKCHIGMFDVEMCRKTIAICSAFSDRNGDIL